MTCEKHDQTMERIFNSINSLDNKMNLVVERENVSKDRVDKIEADLYNKDTGFFNSISSKLAGLKTHIGIMWGLMLLVVSGAVGTLFYLFRHIIVILNQGA